MKTVFLNLVIISSLLSACSSGESQEGTTVEDVSSSETTITATAMTPVIESYLNMKDALTRDDSEAAAEASKQLLSALQNLDAEVVAIFNEQEGGVHYEESIEHAEHITANGGNIEHQREHLAEMTESFQTIVTLAGSDRTLYQIYCPMYDDNEGGYWLSASSEVKNPFYGSTMLTCGVVQEEIEVM